MKEEHKIIGFDACEEGAVIEGLNKIRAEQLAKKESAGFVSGLMLKILRTPPKKARLRNEAR